ncbi:MAG: ABC transporter ATP-binding protein, partial [Gammaproteobacteria bacterium]|nr:ABC transporter ATP-binding protein [Gammaproteobacteria bacterium]
IQIREIRQLITELGKHHGVILSTHILPEVQAVCSHVQIINQGQLVFSESMESLNQHMQCNQILVAFARPPEEQQLLAIAGIKQLDNLQNGRFRLHIENGQSMAELIVSASVAQDWGLLELTPEKQTLEQIFVDLTSGDISKEQAA